MTAGDPSCATAFDGIAVRPRWVAWREETRNGKTTKVPYSPVGQGRAKTNDQSTWGTRDQAQARAERLQNGKGRTGCGIQLGDIGNGRHLCGVDLDSCIDETGSLSSWAQAILDALPTYAERSPSGNGIKAFFGCANTDLRPFLDLLGVKSNKLGTKRSIGERTGEHGPAVEVYCGDRYFTVTEEKWPGQPDQVLRLDWDELGRLARAIPTNGGGKPSSSGSGKDETRSARAFRKGADLRRAGATFEEMCAALRTDPDPEIVEWVREKGEADDRRELHRIWEAAPQAAGVSNGVLLHDFYAYMPQHAYIYAPTGELWPATSVNSRISPVLKRDPSGKIVRDAAGRPVRVKASLWLDQHRSAEQMTWAPGMPALIRDRLVAEGGWIDRPGVCCFNLYRPPLINPGDSAIATPWLDHLHRIYPGEAEHLLQWFAHRVQRPEDKINHAIVLGGRPGIGKDSLLEPVKRAVGPSNWHEVTPRDILTEYNDFAKSVVLRVSEARDLGDTNRFQFYDHMKLYTAAPPDVLRVNEKYARQFYVTNCCGVIITTNHKADGIYLPPDDRRHFVCWSALDKESFEDSYWSELWSWYAGGGTEHVAAYLAQLDISNFNPKAPPPKTPAFLEIVNSNRAPEDAEMADTIDKLGNPPALTLEDLRSKASADFDDWVADRKNRRIIGHRLEACGYVPVHNPDAKDGLWKIGGPRQVIYAQAELPLLDQLAAAQQRQRQPNPVRRWPEGGDFLMLSGAR
jgi:hypothetical protein